MITVDIRLGEVDALLNRISVNGRGRALTKACRAGALFLEAEILKSLEGGGTGRTYRHGNVEHQASAPGEPPATDTGTLAGSIHVVPGDRQAEVVASASYAAYLEFGTSKMAPRPYMRPAVDKHQGELTEVVKQAIIGTLGL